MTHDRPRKGRADNAAVPNQQADPREQADPVGPQLALQSTAIWGDLDELTLMPILGGELMQERLEGLARMTQIVAIERNNVQPGPPDSPPTQIGQSRKGGDQLGGENNNALRHRSAGLINNTPTFNLLRR
jgi:hypothetical protein